MKKRGKIKTSLKWEQVATHSLTQYNKRNKRFYGNHGIKKENDMVQNSEALSKTNIFEEYKGITFTDKECKDYFFSHVHQNIKKQKYLLVRQIDVKTGKHIIVAHILRKKGDIITEDEISLLNYYLKPMNKKFLKDLDGDRKRLLNEVVGEYDDFFSALVEEFIYNRDNSLIKDPLAYNRHYDGEELYKSRKLHLYHEFQKLLKAHILDLHKEMKIDIIKTPFFYDCPRRFYMNTEIAFSLNGKKIQGRVIDFIEGVHDKKIKEVISKHYKKEKEELLKKAEHTTEVKEELIEVIEQINQEIINENGEYDVNHDELISQNDVKDREIRKTESGRLDNLCEKTVREISKSFHTDCLNLVIIANQATDKVFTTVLEKANKVNVVKQVFNYNKQVIKQFTHNGKLEFNIKVLPLVGSGLTEKSHCLNKLVNPSRYKYLTNIVKKHFEKVKVNNIDVEYKMLNDIQKRNIKNREAIPSDFKKCLHKFDSMQKNENKKYFLYKHFVPLAMEAVNTGDLEKLDQYKSTLLNYNFKYESYLNLVKETKLNKLRLQVKDYAKKGDLVGIENIKKVTNRKVFGNMLFPAIEWEQLLYEAEDNCSNNHSIPFSVFKIRSMQRYIQKESDRANEIIKSKLSKKELEQLEELENTVSQENINMSATKTSESSVNEPTRHEKEHEVLSDNFPRKNPKYDTESTKLSSVYRHGVGRMPESYSLSIDWLE